MMDYILIVVVLCCLSLVIIFWPLKLSASKSLAMILVIAALTLLFGINFFRNSTQSALSEYQENKVYQSIVEDYLSGKESAVKNSDDIDPMAFLRSLQRYLQSHSRNSEAWMVLGNALQGVDNNRHSLMAYQRAYRVKPNDEAMAIAYVNARLSLIGEQETVDSESIDVLNKLLQTHSAHENALMLLGVAAYQGKDFTLAVSAWQRLLQALQERAISESQIVPEKVLIALQSSIDKAKEAAKKQTELSSDQHSAFQMQLAITFDQKALAALKNQLSTVEASNPILFVYVRKPNQKGMPLAAIRYPLTDVTVSVNLLLTNQDSLAGIDLSKLESLELSARLSLSGQALAQKGDWQSDPIVINSESFAKAQKLSIYKLFAGS